MALTDNKVSSLKDFSNYFTPRDACNVCGSKEREVWAKADPITAYTCLSCGLVYHDPQLSAEGRAAFYGSGYFELENNPADSELRDKMYEVEIAFLERHTTAGKILDIGCGGGFLLNKFSPQWEKHGIEFDKKAVEHAKKEFKLNVLQGEVNEIAHTPESFDVIIMRGVIEHMADPKTMLAHMVPWLKKGGLLYITSTPNIESLCAELYREKWRLFTADHQLHFAKRTIIDMCKAEQLELLDSAYLYLETPYANEVEDYRKILSDARLIAQNKDTQVGFSPPFYGNMLSLIFQKQ